MPNSKDPLSYLNPGFALQVIFIRALEYGTTQCISRSVKNVDAILTTGLLLCIWEFTKMQSATSFLAQG